jgi:alkylhydroperoxidase family enzyme
MNVNRPVAEASWGLANVLLNEASTPRRLREIAILRTAWNTQAVYEFGQHTLYGREAGLSDDQIYEATQPLDNSRWTEVEALMIRMADDIDADDCVADDTWRLLAEHFSQSDIIELVAVVAYYRLAAVFINSFGVQREAGVPGWPAPVPAESALES